MTPAVDASAVPAPLHVELTGMRRRHLRAVQRIDAQVYAQPWSQALFVSELAHRATRAYFVARVTGNVVGYGGLLLALDDAHITTIVVDPTWQRHGIATRLMLALCREALDRGANAFTLEVRISNAAAQALYRRFGFEPVGVRTRYYQDNDEDALIMWAREVREEHYAKRLARIEAAVVGTTSVERPRPW